MVLPCSIACCTVEGVEPMNLAKSLMLVNDNDAVTALPFFVFIV